MEVAGQHSEAVGAAPGACAELVARFEAYPDWYPGVTDVEVRERDAQGRGCIVALRFDPGLPRVGEIDLVLRYFYASERIWTQYLGGRPQLVEGAQWTFEPLSDGGTRVAYRVRVVMNTGVPGIVERGFRGQARQLLLERPVQTLKHRLEG